MTRATAMYVRAADGPNSRDTWGECWGSGAEYRARATCSPLPDARYLTGVGALYVACRPGRADAVRLSGLPEAAPAAWRRVPLRYTCSGSVRGRCGTLHRTAGAAEACCARDEDGCATQGGYSDRSVIEVDVY